MSANPFAAFNKAIAAILGAALTYLAQSGWISAETARSVLEVGAPALTVALVYLIPNIRK